MNLISTASKTVRFARPLLKNNLISRGKAILYSLVTRKPLRISFAYLHRIKVGNEYLLVFNDRDNKFQPPGGVYKGFANSKLFQSDQVSNDHITNAPEDDFRAILHSPFFLNEFYDDFLSQKNRETEFSREFKEELLETNFLPKREFRWDRLRNKKTQELTEVEIGEDVVSFYHFDIVDFELGEGQRNFLVEMDRYKKRKFLWATRDDIFKKSKLMNFQEGASSIQQHDQVKISYHTKFIA